MVDPLSHCDEFPIKEKLEKTDTLIDQTVYKLYGLAEDEIALIEGRGDQS